VYAHRHIPNSSFGNIYIVIKSKDTITGALAYVYEHEGSVQYDPLQTLANTHFEHMGLSIDPCE
jgi:hypothetical protein